MERACSLVEVDLDKDLGSSGAGSTHWSLHVCCADNCPAGGYRWWIEVTLSEASWVVKIKLPHDWQDAGFPSKTMNVIHTTSHFRL